MFCYVFSQGIYLVLICHLMSEILTIMPVIYVELTCMDWDQCSVLIHK